MTTTTPRCSWLTAWKPCGATAVAVAVDPDPGHPDDVPERLVCQDHLAPATAARWTITPLAGVAARVGAEPTDEQRTAAAACAAMDTAVEAADEHHRRQLGQLDRELADMQRERFAAAHEATMARLGDTGAQRLGPTGSVKEDMARLRGAVTALQSAVVAHDAQLAKLDDWASDLIPELAELAGLARSLRERVAAHNDLLGDLRGVRLCHYIEAADGQLTELDDRVDKLAERIGRLEGDRAPEPTDTPVTSGRAERIAEHLADNLDIQLGPGPWEDLDNSGRRALVQAVEQALVYASVVRT